MRWYRVKIVFMDGEEAEVASVEDTKISNETLHLYRYRPYSGGTEHLGSYPLANIRTYTINESF